MCCEHKNLKFSGKPYQLCQADVILFSHEFQIRILVQIFRALFKEKSDCTFPLLPHLTPVASPAGTFSEVTGSESLKNEFLNLGNNLFAFPLNVFPFPQFSSFLASANLSFGTPQIGVATAKQCVTLPFSNALQLCFLLPVPSGGKEPGN